MTSSSSSSSSNTSSNNELSSFYASFRADDTLIDIIPAFDYATSAPNHHHHDNNNNQNINSTSTLFQSTLATTNVFSGMTDIKAGLTYTVPIWMAIILQQRSFATIVYPDWFISLPNLKYILSYEKTNISLFQTTANTNTTTSTSGNGDYKRHRNDDHDDDRSNDHDDDDDDEAVTTARRQQHQPPSSNKTNNNNNNKSDYFLPSNYYELAMRFKASSSSAAAAANFVIATPTTTTTTTTTMTTSNNNNMDVLLLLIQDIYDIRTDKLRQQFQTLLYETTKHIHPLSDTILLLNDTTTTNTNTNTQPNQKRVPTTTDLIINVTGIGTQELATIQSFVLQAMNDIYYLEELQHPAQP